MHFSSFFIRISFRNFLLHFDITVYLETHVKTYACKSALSIHRWKIFFVASPLFYPFATWMEERGRKRKKKRLFALSRLFREKTLHESVISSRIKTKKKLEGLEKGSRFSWLVVSKQSRACKITRTRISSLEASTGFFLHNVYLLLRMAR